MGFARPELLWLLTILVPLSIWTIRGRWRRRKRWQSLAQRGRPSRDGTPGIVAAIVCLILALAQPRWGHLPGSALPPGHDLVLVIDVSRSMAAEDAVPNRLAVAVEMAKSLVRPLGRDPSNRAAVVAFAGRGVLRCPLTENFGAVLDALGRLRPGSVKPGGTDLGAALDAAIDAVAVGRQEHAQGRAIAIFSDGEDHADRWRSRIERLRQQDIVVHAIAIGDALNGHPVPADKSAQPLTFKGEKVLSKRSDSSLESIARGTGGTIVKLGLASSDLGTLYESKIEPLARRQREASRLAGKAERFPLFLLSALVFLLLGCWPANRGWHWHLGWRGSLGWRRPARALAPASVLVSLAVLAAGATDSQPKVAVESAESTVARGKHAYDDGRLEEALEAFEAAIARAPHLAVPRYNAAATLFQLKQYARARECYQEARLSAGRLLRTKIDYALGNTSLALGEIASAIHAYDDCLASTASGAQIEQVRRDAAINRKFAVEQAESPAIADSENPEGPSRSPRRSGRRGPDPRPDGEDTSPDAQPDSGALGAGANPEGDDPDERNRPPNRRRRTGGAGGTGKGPQESRGDTPDDRLDAALEHIREAAESRRLPEELPPDRPTSEGKDW
jgi:Ca-activated chloride channel homolog